MIRSLHGRLIAVVALTVVTLFAVTGIVVCVFFEASLWSEFDAGLRDRVLTLSQLIEQDQEGVSFEWDAELQLTPLASDGEFLTIWDGDKAPSVLPPDADPLDIPAGVTRGGTVMVLLTSGKRARTTVLTFQPRIEYDDEESGDTTSISFQPRSVTLVFTRETANVDATIRRLRWTLTSVGIAGLLITVVLSWIAVGYGLKPIEQTARQIAAIDADTLDARIEESPKQPRELQPLVGTINRLLERLQAAFSRERAFSSDVAHELRTPLAGIRAKLEVALTKSRSAADHEETMRQCLAITEQTSTIVASLLATTQTGRESVSEANDLKEFIIEAVETNGDGVAERELKVLWEIPDGAVIKGPPHTVSMLFRNLIDNAVAYADAGSTINITAEVTPKSLSVQISNPARDFPANDIDKVFDRFWRADTSRTETGKHSGLGLPLCKRLAESLGGTIEATCEEQIFTICVRFAD